MKLKKLISEPPAFCNEAFFLKKMLLHPAPSYAVMKGVAV
ncbi:hypothetical protein BAXH7_03175 [Bacillus amyloliquefaciens XH7]|nr:hypothetical protein LL3_03194 [Bacillus amyloliquefaciens LL3]AEK90295.1 hypothetical protein BAXH7_03175 [Bacillus amyloliquefaciens XH7]KYC99490.1 hypothetical protein B425_3975 [Bacillus amyloliquefaciens]QBG57563.1 hypothetical protein D2M30_3262 [Bacillus amyloliquefaciens]